jgi:membrane protease subunit HflK
MNEQKRGRNTALGGALLQTAAAVVLLIIWRMTDSVAALTGLWLLIGGVLLWGVTMLLFYARQMELQEETELKELAQHDTIFDEAGADRPARRRLAALQRWAVPIFTLMFAGYHATLAIWMLRYVRGTELDALRSAGPAAGFLSIVGMAMFLLSRYCTGMSSTPAWRLLRAPGGYMLVCVLFFTVLLIDMLVAMTGSTVIDPIAAIAFPLIELIFAAEMLLNFVLDLYRPRLPGDEYRPSYDSRIFNLLAEPGRVGHSIAEAINYQFGFEVSRTWFYQLISRAFVPLLMFGVLVLLALSSMVIVDEGEVCYVKHWGRLSSDTRPLTAGVHFKWPWPIDTAESIRTGEVHEILLGLGEQKDAKIDKSGNLLLLWTEEHGYGSRLENDFLIGASPRDALRREKQSDESEKAPTGVSIIKLVVLVQYRITSPYEYAYRTTDAKTLITDVATQEMMQYCASATLDEIVDEGVDRPQALMTTGRSAAAKTLQARLQKRMDELKLGVELLYVGVLSAHPPSEAVPQFEKVLEAERLQDKQRYEAQAEANKTLAGVAGDPGKALQLYVALHRAEVLDELQKFHTNAAKFTSAVNDAVDQAAGQVGVLDDEIHREELLGKKKSDLETRINLKKAYESLLAELQSAKNNRETFDYAKTLADAQEDVETRFDELEGEPAKLIAQARAYRWDRELSETTRLELYRQQLLPFQTAPTVYRFSRYMDVLDETLPNTMKYVIGVNRDLLELRLNLETQEKDVLDAATEGKTE